MNIHIVRKCLALAAVALMPAQVAMAQTPPAQAPTPPPGCTAPEHSQFDFWVGRWDVYVTGTQRLVAHSLIEKLYMGCAIRENWMPLSGGPGGSLNSYLPGERLWRQTWTDSSNSYAVFEGRYENNEMVMTGIWAGSAGPGSRPLTRMHWARLDGGGVRQHGESSTDNGQTWTASFDFTYRPAARAATP